MPLVGLRGQSDRTSNGISNEALAKAVVSGIASLDDRKLDATTIGPRLQVADTSRPCYVVAVYVAHIPKTIQVGIETCVRDARQHIGIATAVGLAVDFNYVTLLGNCMPADREQQVREID